MKIYLAGNVGTVERERINQTIYKTRLFSYFYILPDQIEHKVFKWVKYTLQESQAGESPVIV
jgi:hypothetical protein